MSTNSSQTATSSVSSSLQQCIEEKIHSVTSELVDQLLTLPNVVWVELSGHLGVTINNCFSFTVLPKPSGLLKRNKNKLCADVPGKNQCTVSDLGEDSAEREATEYVHVSATGFGKDSIENEATKCVPETGWGNDSAEREATEHVHVSVTGFGKDSIENAGTKCAPETGWGNDSAEKEATEHVAETSLSKNFIKSKATEHASETDLDKDATESEATEQVLETALDRDAAEDSSDLKSQHQVLRAEQSDKERFHGSSYSSETDGVTGRKRHKADSSEAKASSIQDDIHSSGDAGFNSSTSKGNFKQPGLPQKASTEGHKTTRTPAQRRSARVLPQTQRKLLDSRQEETFADCWVRPKGSSDSMQESRMKFDDRDRSTELTKEESPAAAAKQRRGNQEPKGEAGKDSLELQCSVCDRKYPMEKHRAFKQHVKKHERSVQCETCGKWLSCSDSLKHHQRGLHSTQKPYTCEECGMSFNFHHSFKLHRYKHSGTRPHACPHCPKSYLTSNHLKAHLRAAHSTGKDRPLQYQCEICGRSFASTGSLKNHSFRHSDVKPYHCDVCSKGFNSKSALKVHSKSVHVTERKFECDVCHKFYKSEHIRNIHRRRHLVEQSAQFICDVCGRQFQFQSSLKAHAGVHRDAFPYTCQICGKGFKLLPSLYSHRYTHTSERPYQCSLCPKAFKSKSTCTAHERRHNATKSFACHTCSARFPDKGALDKHTRTIHTPTRMFQCTICGKTGARMDNMRTHTKSHRRDWTVEQMNACIRQISH